MSISAAVLALKNLAAKMITHPAFTAGMKDLAASVLNLDFIKSAGTKVGEVFSYESRARRRKAAHDAKLTRKQHEAEQAEADKKLFEEFFEHSIDPLKKINMMKVNWALAEIKRLNEEHERIISSPMYSEEERRALLEDLDRSREISKNAYEREFARQPTGFRRLIDSAFDALGRGVEAFKSWFKSFSTLFGPGYPDPTPVF